MIGLGIHLPQQVAFSTMGIDLVYGAPSVSHVHEPILDNGGAFQPAMCPDAAAFNATKVHGPRNLQVLDGILVDLLEIGEAGGCIVLVVMEPVAWLLVYVEQTVLCYLVRRACQRDAREADSCAFQRHQ